MVHLSDFAPAVPSTPQASRRRIEPAFIVVAHALAALLIGPIHCTLDALEKFSWSFPNYWQLFILLLVHFVAVALAPAQISLIAMCTSMSRRLLALRLAVSILAVAALLFCYWFGRAIASSLLGCDLRWLFYPFGNWTMLGVGESLVIAFCYLTTVQVVAHCVCALLRLAFVIDGVEASRRVPRFQVTLIDALLLTLLIGILLGLGRLVFLPLPDAFEFRPELDKIVVVAVHGIVVTPMLFYLAFQPDHSRKKNRWRRMPLIAGVCMVESAVFACYWFACEAYAFTLTNVAVVFLLQILYIITVSAIQLFIMDMTLYALRLAGVRVVRC